MIGIDLVAITRIERLARTDWFAAFWLNPLENQHLIARPNYAETLAGLIASKEAVMKASNSVFRNGHTPRDISLSWSSSGQPSARIGNRLYAVSITHTDEYAAAVATTLETI